MQRLLTALLACWSCVCPCCAQWSRGSHIAHDEASADHRLAHLLFAINGHMPARSSRHPMRISSQDRLVRHAVPHALAEVAELPPDAIILKEEDKAIWDAEVLEFNGLVSDPTTPYPLQAYLRSYQAPDGSYCHAFDGSGVPLSSYEASFKQETDDECPVLDDGKRLRLIAQLLEAINALHDRGSAHLALDANVIRIAPLDVNKPDSDLELRIIGLGASVKLGKGRFNFQLDESTAFHAPELLASPILATNLEALFKLDSWSVGVLIVMLVTGLSSSPFEAKADWKKGVLSDTRAVLDQIDKMVADFQYFLLQSEEASCGMLFRHGWLVKIITGLLSKKPEERLSLKDALEIATQGLKDEAARATPLASTSDSAVTPSVVADAADVRSDGAAAAASGSSAASLAAGILSQDGPMVMQDLLDARDSASAAASAQASLSAREQFRSKVLKGQSSEPYRSLQSVISIVKRGKSSFILQDQSKYPESNNYGELKGFRNKVDKERWDILVPAIDAKLPRDTPIRMRSLIGVIMVPGGNHKLVVEPDTFGSFKVGDQARIDADVQKFTRTYAEKNNIDADQIKYLNVDDIKF